MKKISNKIWSAIVVGLLCVLFNVITLVVSDLEAVKASFWCAYAFINLSFVLIAVLFLITKVGKNDVISIFVPQYLITAIYFGLTFVINFFFLVLPSTDKVTANVIINVIIIILYIAVMIIVNMGASHIKQNEENIAKNVSALRGLEIKINALSYSVTDPVVKKKIVELKDKVHFSDPMSNASVTAIEQEIVEMVDTISSLISSGVDSEAILAAVNDCIIKVKIRNQTLMASK